MKKKTYNPFTKEYVWKEVPERIHIKTNWIVTEHPDFLSFRRVSDWSRRKATLIYKYVPKWLIALWGAE